MATAKIAIGEVLETVSQTAKSVSSLINVTTKGVGMLDAIVTKAATQQRKRYMFDSEMFDQNLVREYAQTSAEADIQVLEFCAKSEAHKDLFEKNFDRFSNLLQPKSPE